jgi:cell division protein ZapA (FtsZ GTPase activity inhibitor)
VKRTVTLEIAGTKFRLVTDADESHLEELAAIVNQRVEELGGSGRAPSSAQLLALAALGLADSLKGAEARLHQVDELTRTAITNAIARIDSHIETDSSSN